MILRCDLKPQFNEYKEDILRITENVFDSGKYLFGPYLDKFESDFSNYIGCKYTIGVANGTSALSIILKSIGVKPGDEIITTPFTAVPTLIAIIEVGAIPIFADIDPDTWLMNYSSIQENITEKTKAIIPVHIFGNVFNVEKFKEHVSTDVPIIEDACQAHGSHINNIKAGNLGLAAAFSFYPTKNLGGYGDGGAICTNSEKIAEFVQEHRFYGINKHMFIEEPGTNSRLDEIQAAILSRKLIHLDSMNAKRNQIAEFYKENLPTDFISFQKITGYSNHHIFSCSIDSKYRDSFREYLENHNIQTNIYYPYPLSHHPFLKDCSRKKDHIPVTEKICNEMLALPMYAELPFESVQYIVNTAHSFLKEVYNE